MGSSVSPVNANIYKEYFESLAIPSSPTLIKWWFMYAEDVHSATRKDQVNKLQVHLNSIDPHIKCTIELPWTDGIPFLDTLTKPIPNFIESTVYRKPTQTDRYLDYNYNHPISAKLSVIHTLIHRAKQICSTHEFFPKEMVHLHKVLQDNHYPTQFFQQGKPQQKNQQKAYPTHSKVYRRTLSCHTIHQRPQWTVQTYPNKIQLKVFFKGTSTIKSLLVHPKDPIPDEQKTHIIYHWKCPANNCTAECIGETNRSLKEGVSDQRNQTTSVIRNHQFP